MYNDSEIQNWIQKHGVVTSFTFIIYGTIITSDIDILTHGLILQLKNELNTGEMIVLYDPITEDEARAWEVFQGTSLVFIIAKDMAHLENRIKEIVLHGLDFLRFKANYLGSTSSDSNV
tara:strand:- start:1806 stop:2162 length:357 start_codon:yes stop_codon:yes gene_type:complete